MCYERCYEENKQRNHRLGENIYQTHIYMGQVSNTYKEPLKLSYKKKTQLENVQCTKDPNRHLNKEDDTYVNHSWIDN